MASLIKRITRPIIRPIERIVNPGKGTKDAIKEAVNYAKGAREEVQKAVDKERSKAQKILMRGLRSRRGGGFFAGADSGGSKTIG